MGFAQLYKKYELNSHTAHNVPSDGFFKQCDEHDGYLKSVITLKKSKSKFRTSKWNRIGNKRN